MRVLCFVFLASVWAEPPVPGRFQGYEKGGYEIEPENLKTFPGGDQLNFPVASDTSGGSDITRGGSDATRGGSDVSAGSSSIGDSPSGQGSSLGQQRGSSRFRPTSLNDVERERSEEGGRGSLDDIPGVPGKDFPIYGEIPKTSFSCKEQAAPGYYADLEAQCQVFHICQKGGQMNSVLCPNGTIFNQRVFVCSWWYDFDCASAPALFALNAQVNAEGEAAAAARKSQDSRQSLGNQQGNGPRPAKLSDVERGGAEGVGEVQDIANIGTNTIFQEDLTTSDGYPAGRSQGFQGRGGSPGYNRERGRDEERISNIVEQGGRREAGEGAGYSRGGNTANLNREYPSPAEGAAGGFASTERSYLPPL